ncbi:EAL domain-containing protein [Delftia sp. PS-11]|uniref:bifunctional diguanylate cyclase/phosphodiesterase n=1 Tax=Delftia sp. PS-11 TaxID=2767222 RepID=UPI003AB22721
MTVMAAGVCISAVLALMQQRSLEQMDAQRHLKEAQAAAQALQTRLGAYASAVQHAAYRLASSPEMGQQAFSRMAQSLRVHALPGMQAMVFTRAMPGSLVADFGKTAEFSPLPPDAQRYFVIDYLWPLDGNESIVGLDLYGRPGGVPSLLRARDTGSVVISAPFALKQPGEHVTGILVRAPVFVPPAPPEAGGETISRRFLGTVDVSIRIQGLMQDLYERGLLSQLALAVHDVGLAGAPAGKAPLPLYLGAAWPQAGVDDAGQGLFEQSLQIQDRLWRLQFMPTGSSLSWPERAQPTLLFTLGLLASGVLSALVMVWWRRRHSGWAQLRASSRSMRESDARFQALFEQAAVGVVQIEAASGLVLHVNRRCCEITGHEVQELCRRHVLSLLEPEQVQADMQLLTSMAQGRCRELQIERQLRRKDGSLVWVEVNVSVLGRGRSMRLLALVQDISARRRLLQMQRDGSRHLRMVIQRLPVGLAMLQGDGRFAYWNEEFLRLAGSGASPGMNGDGWWCNMCPDEPRRERMQRRFEAAQARARVAQDVQSGPQDSAGGALSPEEYMLIGSDGRSRAVSLGGLLLDEGCLLILQDQSERKMAEEEIRRLAFYDALTGLPNRRLLVDRLQQALAAGRRRGRFGAVLLLDVDNFKGFNDALGLERGDVLLRLIAERMLQSFGHEATIARHGGDDFVVLLEDLGTDSMQAASHLEGEVQRMRDLLQEPLRVGDLPCHITLSVGVSLFSDQELTADEVLRRAEMAMYQAKGMGRNTLQFYDPQLQAVLRSRTSMEQEMREGLVHAQFALYYQPQVSNGHIVGAEGLLRWNHPREGFIPPAVFVSLAEETGLILQLGEWVLDEACRQLASWAAQPEMAELVLAVNVSPRQFHQAQFVQQVLQALERHGADPRLLKLELTESLLLADVDDTAAKMAQLKAHGVGFSLDDFGTGYSSLAYLKCLPLDQLKIDRSFVRDVLSDPNDAAIARTIVALGTSLGLQVIAEGVETEEQRQFLEEQHCHAWQGYLLSAPVPVGQFEALVRRLNAASRNLADIPVQMPFAD